jgi:hypothetical protein
MDTKAVLKRQLYTFIANRGVHISINTLVDQFKTPKSILNVLLEELKAEHKLCKFYVSGFPPYWVINARKPTHILLEGLPMTDADIVTGPNGPLAELTLTAPSAPPKQLKIKIPASPPVAIPVSSSEEKEKESKKDEEIKQLIQLITTEKQMIAKQWRHIVDLQLATQQTVASLEQSLHSLELLIRGAESKLGF